MKISSYVTFFGNCRDAVDFYKDVFELSDVKIETFEDKSNQFAFELPTKCKNLVFRAELNIKSEDSDFSIIMADSPVLVFNADMIGNGNNKDNITFEISGKDKEWIEKTYDKLLKGGIRNTPLKNNPGSNDLSGSLIDKFGICWILCWCSCC